MVSNKKRKPVFIKRKWNHVVFSRATILSFHPVEGSNRSWDLYTTGQLVDGLQQKKENRFSLNGNGIMSSEKRRQFYRSTRYLLSFSAMCNTRSILKLGFIMEIIKLPSYPPPPRQKVWNWYIQKDVHLFFFLCLHIRTHFCNLQMGS